MTLFSIALSLLASSALAADATEAQVSAAPYEVLGLTPDHSTLEDAQRVLGPAKVGTVADHGHESHAVCYRGKAATLVLEDGFFNPTTVGRIYLTQGKLPTEFQKLECATSAKLDEPVRLSNGVGLGLAPSELEKVLGKPKAKSAAEWKWDWSHYHRYTDAEKAKPPTAPGGGSYKGFYRYLGVKAVATKDRDRAKQRITKLDVVFSGETDW